MIELCTICDEEGELTEYGDFALCPKCYKEVTGRCPKCGLPDDGHTHALTELGGQRQESNGR